MDKRLICKIIDDDKDQIIKLYQSGMHILEIADIYGVIENTIYVHLKRWGIPIIPGTYHRRREYYRRKNEFKNHIKRKFSPELKAIMKENSRANEGKVKYITVTDGWEWWLYRRKCPRIIEEGGYD